MQKLTAVAFAAACIGAAWGWASGTVDELLDSSQGAIPACEDNLKSTLKSPSSYKRVEAEIVYAPPLSFELYRKFELTKGCKGSTYGEAACIEGNAFFHRAIRENVFKASGKDGLKGKSLRAAIEADWRQGYQQFIRGWPGQTASAAIEYEAQNSFGAVLTGSYVCDFGRKSSEGFSKSDIFLPSADVTRYYSI